MRPDCWGAKLYEDPISPVPDLVSSAAAQDRFPTLNWAENAAAAATPTSGV
jgi:hypothetical protein